MVPFYTYFITCNSTATIKDVIGRYNAIRGAELSFVNDLNHVDILHAKNTTTYRILRQKTSPVTNFIS